MLAFWNVCKHSHEHEKQKTKEEKKVYGVANMDCLHDRSLENKESRLWRKVNDQLFVCFTLNR